MKIKHAEGIYINKTLCGNMITANKADNVIGNIVTCPVCCDIIRLCHGCDKQPGATYKRREGKLYG